VGDDEKGERRDKTGQGAETLTEGHERDNVTDGDVRHQTGADYRARGRGWSGALRRVLLAVSGLGVLALPGPIDGAGAARRSPLEGSTDWIRVQGPLLDPATSLRTARSIWKQGDHRRAERLLEELPRRHAIIADYADWMRVQVLIELGRNEQAAELASQAATSYPDSPLRSDFYRLLGDVRVRLEDDEAARLAWRRALDETRDAAEKARLLESTAISEQRAGQPRAAARTYALLWSLHPTSPEAAAAEKQLEALDEELQTPVIGPSDWRRRGDNLFRKRRNREALEAYDRALELGLSESAARRVGKQRARALFRMRLYPEATRAFRALPDIDDVALWRARSLARAGDVPQAIREFERLGRRTRGELGTRATYLAAVLLEGRGQHVRARRHLRKVTASRRSPGLVSAALWSLAWGSYQDSQYTEAISLFEALLARESDPIGALRTRYWRARALERVDDEPSKQEALREFTEIAREYPLSYYGWRACGRVPAHRLQATTHKPTAMSEGKRALPDPALRRPRILLAAGLVEQALEEMERVRGRARGLADRLTLAQLFTEAGDYRQAQRLVVDAYTEALARGPIPSLEELWWHAWPPAYGDLVAASIGASDSVDSALVLSIMREESGFRPRAVSPNGARGLLQIMPPTGERLAHSVGHEDFSADDLFEPEINIRLGSHYLDQLSRRFGGQLSAAIASYNAGPDKVSEWVAAHRDLDGDDEWVEAIPYSQTRAYVKRVLRSLHAYRVLY
jgi:soluble lytic murein transglycosylase